MTERIAIIQGHPDGDSHHLCHALSEAYAKAAIAAGHDVRVIEVGKLNFPLIRNKMEWENDPLPPALCEAQNDLLWAEHWALFYPIWLGAMRTRTDVGPTLGWAVRASCRDHGNEYACL